MADNAASNQEDELSLPRGEILSATVLVTHSREKLDILISGELGYRLGSR